MNYGKIQVKIKTSAISYPINIYANELPLLWRKEVYGKKNKILLVADEYVYSLYGKEFSLSSSAGKVLKLAAGEENKNFRSIEKIYEALNEMDADRETRLISLGGGIIGDMVGFAASTYLRGISYIQIPTTLLSQIDSSVGGKTGINYGAKNRIGTFYHPQAVYIDSFFWRTLDERDWINGLGEMVKYAAITDREFFYSMLENLPLIMKRNGKIMNKLLKNGIMFKSRVIEMDEKEQGRRRILNFGHTLGHAIETAGNYEVYKHGEAIMLGMAAVLYISLKRNLLPSEEYENIMKLIRKVYDAKLYENITTSEITKLLKKDKKIKNNQNVWVLLKEIGVPEIVDDVNENEIIEALESLR